MRAPHSLLVSLLAAMLALHGCSSSQEEGSGGSAGDRGSNGGAGGSAGSGASGGSGGGAGSAGSGGEGGSGDPGWVLSPEMECVQVGFPCSMAEMSDEVHDTAIAILFDALEVLDSTGMMASARAFLEGHADVIEVLGDETALRFRIEASTPIWLLDVSDIVPEAPSPALKSLGAPAGFGTKGIVGADTSGDAKIDNHDEKRALVLAPYEWQFKPWDESDLLSGQLESLRGYEGNVTFKNNPTKTDQNIVLADYAGWREFDLIYLSTHGQRVCRGMPQECVVVISSGVYWDLDNRPEMISVPGVVPLGRWNREEGYESQYVQLGLTLGFFQSVYGDGLDDALLHFSACETGASGASELAQAIGGDDFVMFGWTEVVPVSAAFQASSLLFEKLGQGLPADIALDEVRTAGLHSALNARGVTTVLTRFAPNGGDQRLYELPILLDEEGEELEDGANITSMLEGAVGDGQTDRLKLKIRVDGVNEDTIGSFTVRYRLDDMDLPGSYDLFSASPTAQSEYQYEAEHEIDLGFDMKAMHGVSLEAIVELPEGGESRFSVDVTFSPIKVAVWYSHHAQAGLPGNSGCENPDLDDDFAEETIGELVDPTLLPAPSDYWFERRTQVSETVGASGTRFFSATGGGSCGLSAGFRADAELASSVSVPRTGDRLDVDIAPNASSNCELLDERPECAEASAGTQVIARFDAAIEEEVAFRLQAELDCKAEYPASVPMFLSEVSVQVLRFNPEGDGLLNHPTKPYFGFNAPCRTGDDTVRVDQVVDFSAPAEGTSDRVVFWVQLNNVAGGNTDEGTGTVSRNSFMRGFLEVTPTSPTSQ